MRTQSPSPDFRFPAVQSRYEFPVRRVSMSVRIRLIFNLWVFWLFTGVSLWAAVAKGLWCGDDATTFGGFGSAVFFGGIGLLGVLPAWMPNAPTRSRTRSKVDPTYGRGVLLVPRRTSALMYVLYTSFLGGGIFGVTTWALRGRGRGDVLLDPDKSTWYPLFLGVAALIVVPLLMVGMHYKFRIELYPSGIRRLPPARFVTPVQFTAWDDIESLNAGVFQPKPNAHRFPTIDLNLLSTQTQYFKAYDSPNRVALPIWIADVERNSTLAILRHLHEHPESRRLLARPDAPSWFSAITVAEQPDPAPPPEIPSNE